MESDRTDILPEILSKAAFPSGWKPWSELRPGMVAIDCESLRFGEKDMILVYTQDAQVFYDELVYSILTNVRAQFTSCLYWPL